MRSYRNVLSLVILIVIVLVTLNPQSNRIARAAIISVTNLNDSGSGSLRQAIADAANNDLILFASGVSGTLTLTSGELVISKPLSIGVTDATNTITISGNNASRIFNVTSTGNIIVFGLTLANGNGGTSSGAIYNAGVLNLAFALVTNNSGAYGAIYNTSSLSNAVYIVNSTVTGNSATQGGAISNAAGTMTITNATIANNSGVDPGVNLLNSAPGQIVIKNSIILTNTAGNNCSGVTDNGNNIQYPGTSCGASMLSQDPLLGSLADNGGLTQTMALQSGSPAIDTGDNATCTGPAVISQDQRAYVRPVDGNGDSIAVCDSGAYEALSAPPPTPTLTGTPTSTNTFVPTNTFTPTQTPTNTRTPVGTATPTSTPSNTRTPSLTYTPSRTKTNTPLPTASATSGAALVVTTLVDSNNGGCGEACSLRDAVAAAPWNGVITFAPGLTGTISLTSPISFAKSLTITGPTTDPITLNANGQANIFVLNMPIASKHNPLFTLSNLTLTNALNRAVSVQNASLVLSNCSFVANRSNSTAGAVYFYTYFGGNARLSIDSCTFTNNTAVANGGAIHADVEYSTGFTMTVTNSTFTSNQGANGGALYFYALSSPGGLTVNQSVFDSNSATGSYGNGGAIKTYGSPITTISAAISNSLFTNNSAVAAGGGIDNSSNLTVTQSAFVGNRVTNGTSTGSGGGAIRNFTGNVTAANTTFTGNSVAGNYVFGSVLHSYGGIVTFTNNTVANNTGTKGNGALTNYSSGGTFILRNTIIANNGVPNCAPYFPFTNGGHNLQYPGTSCGAGIASADPLLLPLANNGGSTPTMALSVGSPAVDAGDNGICAAAPVNNVDQRSSVRPVDGNGDGSAICDIGAYENSAPPTPTSTETATDVPAVPTNTPVVP